MHSTQNLTNYSPKLLLKEAASRSRAGDFDYAIQVLRSAYRQILKQSERYPIDIYLRLPLYLQRADKAEEAWKVLNRMLVEGYPGQDKHPGAVAMDDSTIYDKMRILLQRENRYQEAVKFGVFSYLLWGIGLYHYRQRSELKSHLSARAIRRELQSLLNKTERQVCCDPILQLIDDYLVRFPRLSFPKLGREINEIIL